MGGVGYGAAGVWDDSAMVRQAEERTRSTFQSVETVVGAFASVSHLSCTLAPLHPIHIFIIRVVHVHVYKMYVHEHVHVHCIYNVHAEVFSVCTLCICYCV